jgi:hypothetical protein
VYAALLRRLLLVELDNFDKNRCEIPLFSGVLERYLLFLRWLVERYKKTGRVAPSGFFAFC